MIVATLLNGKKVGIFFAHLTSETGQRSTVATIAYLDAEGKKGAVIKQESVRCSLQDNFCKATGRKLALTRALERSFLMRGDRTNIWDAYFSRDSVAAHWNADHPIARFEDDGAPPEQRTGDEPI